jgi:hypothetical protein
MPGARQDEGRKIIMKRLVRGEKGYILIAALLVLVLVGLISGPLLSYMVSGLKAGHTFETGAAELYAADAGVQDAVLRIPKLGLCPAQNTTHYIISDVNGKSIDVTVTLTNNVTGALTYKITSTAVTYDGGNTAALASGTTVESYLQFTPGGELNIFSGALASQTSIDLKKGSTINGDVYSCSGTTLKHDDISGNWTYQGCGQFPKQPENVAFANAMKTLAMAGGTVNGLTIDSDTSLGPKYINGDLYISKDVTVTITGVVYVTGTIDAKKEFTLAGCGVIVAEGDIYLSKIAGFGSNCDSMIMSLNGDITFKKEATVNALVYAPNGAVSFDMGATIYGGVVAESIQADMNGSFTYVQRSNWDLPGQLPGAYAIETYDVSRLS